jgi:hypothetical protein
MNPSPTRALLCRPSWRLLPLLAVLVTACEGSADGDTPAAPELTAGALLGAADDPHRVTLPGGADSVSVPAGGGYFFRLSVPAGHDGLRLAVRGDATTSLRLRRGGATGTILASSLDRAMHTLFLTSDQTVADDLWFLEVTSTSGAVVDLYAEPRESTDLTWDTGETLEGTSVVTSAGGFGDRVFRVTSRASRFGAWRNVLRVTSGEAHLYVARGAIPSDSSFWRSTTTGSDAVYLASENFQDAQTWYVRVGGTSADAAWSLVSGDVHVVDLGPLADDPTPRSLPLDVGGLGWFRTEATEATLAWQLAAESDATLRVHTTRAPLPGSTSSTDATFNGEGLLVPGYVTTRGYLVGVSRPGAASATITSGNHRIRTPSGDGFELSLDATVEGFGYATWRVTVPTSQIGWQVAVEPADGGDFDLYVGRGRVAGPLVADALAEAPGAASDAVTLTPPFLTDGVWYVTVRGRGSYRLRSGRPVTTTLPFDGVVTNAPEYASLAGARYFVLTDLAAQTGALGWQLALSGQAAGTRLAIRRNALPGARTSRSWSPGRTPSDSLETSADAASDTGWLDRPGHEADVWYVAVERTAGPVGPFTLTSLPMVATDLAFNGGALTVTDHDARRFKYFRVTVPADAVGWDLGLDQVTSGQPQLVVRAERIPGDLGTQPERVWQGSGWSTGQQYPAGLDATWRAYDGTVDVTGRRLLAGLGSPLRSGVVYVGVAARSAQETGSMAYRIRSRGVGEGAGWSIPVAPLAFDGGEAQVTGLLARDLAVFRVDVPDGAQSFEAAVLAPRGDALLLARRGGLPNNAAEAWIPYAASYGQLGSAPGTRRDTPGATRLFRYARAAETAIPSGPHYLVVASLGEGGTRDRLTPGTTADVRIQSLGEVAPVELGDIEEGPATGTSGLIACGEQRAFTFTVPAGLAAVELEARPRPGLPGATGNISASFSLASGARLPEHNSSLLLAEGGVTRLAGGDSTRSGSDRVVTIANPAGRYSALVSADCAAPPAAGGVELVVTPVGRSPLPFNGGEVAVTAQPPGTWRYVEVDVPADALGWELRLAGVSGGDPRIVIRRDEVPTSLGTTNGLPSRPEWRSGESWAPDGDLTLRRRYGPSGAYEAGRAVVMGLGSPLSPGRYVVGVLNNATGASATDSSWRIVSRGIGVGADSAGAPWVVQVADLDFAGGTATATLPARGHVWYRVTVPEATAAWGLALEVASGEALMAVRRGVLPTPASEGNPEVHGGAARVSHGDEFFYRYQDTAGGAAPSGTYYVGVASEGVTDTFSDRIGTGESTFTLRSDGTISPQQTVLGATPTVFTGQRFRAGEQRTWRVEVPAGSYGFRVDALNLTGQLRYTLARDGFPRPWQSVTSSYGGLSPVASDTSERALTVTTNPAGVWFLTVAGDSVNGAEPVSTADLRITRLTEVVPPAPVAVDVAFNGGEAEVSDHAAGTWRYVRVVVPSDAVGWNLVIDEVSGGTPRMTIRRDLFPDSATGTSNLFNGRTWSTGQAQAIGYDYTGRTYAPQITGQSYVEVTGQVATIGLGRPLEPGTYLVGVRNASTTGAASWRIRSRGVGVGTTADGAPWAITVRDLQLGGSEQIVDLPARETVWYRVEVPAGMADFHAELETVVGEGMLVIGEGGLPNPYASTVYTSSSAPGTSRTKVGSEYFYHLPDYTTSATATPARTFYLGVTSEGRDPASTAHVGALPSTLRLHVRPGTPLRGTPGAVVEDAPLAVRGERLPWGAQARYSFRVPPTVDAFEVRLANRTGSPGFAALIDPFGAGRLNSYNGAYTSSERGASSTVVTSSDAWTFAGQPGDVNLTVSASSWTVLEQGYDLIVTPQRAKAIAWDGADEAVTLKSNETAWFKVELPAQCDPASLGGWLVENVAQTGTATVTLRPGLLPTAPGSAPSYSSSGLTQILTAPQLTGGVWYIAVNASSAPATMRLRTQAIRALRAWNMPPRLGTATTPGLTHPVIGDSGVSAAGVASAGDGGLDLARDAYHHYRVRVPSNNGGLMVTRLIALSGNPQLYIRRNAAAHANVTNLWSDTQSGTTYAHWTPYNTRYGEALEAGEYWLAVRAEYANARYRLVVEAEGATDLALDGGAARGRTLAAGDMHHYRVAMPPTGLTDGPPQAWTLGLVETSGDAIVTVREEVPSGIGSSTSTPSSVTPIDLASDRSVTAPRLLVTGTTTIAPPILRPGSTYFVSVFARSNLTYDLTSQRGPASLTVSGVHAFAGETLDVSVPAGTTRVHRVDVPPDAVRWRHDATIPTGVTLRLSPRYTLGAGTTPVWTSSGTGSGADLDRGLDAPDGYAWDHPWEPGVAYYLEITNTGASAAQVTVRFDGARTWADTDADGLPDGWEYRHFGHLANNAASDWDSDGLTAAQELAAGTDPRKSDSDGDGLEDDIEVAIGTGPTLADTDGDGLCDGDDSGPDDPDEVGPVIRLVMGRWEGGRYGSTFGTARHRTRLVATLAQTGEATHWIHLTGLDVDAADELEVRLNGTLIGHAVVGADGGRSTPTFLVIRRDALRANRLNRLELRQKTIGEPWGVEDMGLFSFGQSFGNDCAAGWDRRHPEGFDMRWFGAVDDQWLEARVLDLERPDDVSVTVDGATYLPSLESTAEGAWSGSLLLPLAKVDWPQLAGGGQLALAATVRVRPREGSDGCWQLALDGSHPLRSTFGTAWRRGLGDALAREARFVLPAVPQLRQLAIRHRADVGDSVQRDQVGGASTTAPGAGSFTSVFSVFGAEGVIGRLDVARVAGPNAPASPTFGVEAVHYGACLDLSGNGVPDCQEVCTDADSDGVAAVSRLCASGADCDDNDASLGATSADGDCDRVHKAEDCNDADPAVTNTNVDDADCDLIPTPVDCDDADPAVMNTNLNDADCDAVPTDADCDDADPAVTNTNIDDADCDTVPTAADCDDADSEVTNANLDDTDCDTVPTAADCDDANPEVTNTSIDDADCDTVPTEVDCDDANPEVTNTSADDADCDTVPTEVDCDDANPEVTNTSIDDADCDLVVTDRDCDDTNPEVTNTNLNDADCDTVPTAADCDDRDPANVRDQRTDSDCDGVTADSDCDDRDPAVTRPPDANDRDCDGLPAPLDCDDTDRAMTRSRVDDADCDEVPTASDCDDQDPSERRQTTGDGDCDGVPSARDCDDSDPANTLDRSADADCDGTPATADCDDANPAVGECPVCLDADEDGHDGRTERCPSGDDCADDEPGTTAGRDDADCDGVPADADCDDDDPAVLAEAADLDCDGAPDAADNCPETPNAAQADADGDGVGDVCPDDDGDGFVGEDDNCPDAPNPDQADADRDGLGDACDDDAEVVTDEDAQGFGCGGGDSSGLAALAGALLFLAATRRRRTTHGPL